MPTISRAHVSWSGSLASGAGKVDANSRSFVALPVSWNARTSKAEGQTTPEELLAAAHASCFAMALSGQLAEKQARPEHLDVEAAVTFDKTEQGWKVVSSSLTVKGNVPGIDKATFQQAAEAAKSGCPVSQALRGNVALSVEAVLEGQE